MEKEIEIIDNLKYNKLKYKRYKEVGLRKNLFIERERDWLKWEYRRILDLYLND